MIGPARLTYILPFLAGVVAAQSVHTDFDETANFERFRTFAWKPHREKGQLDSTLLGDRVRRSVEAQLVRKGMAKSERRPDVWLDYSAAVKERREALGSRGGSGRYGRQRSGTRTTTRYLEGQYSVEMTERETRKTVFQAHATLTGSDPLDLTEAKQMEKIAEKAFKNYPPQKK